MPPRREAVESAAPSEQPEPSSRRDARSRSPLPRRRPIAAAASEPNLRRRHAVQFRRAVHLSDTDTDGPGGDTSSSTSASSLEEYTYESSFEAGPPQRPPQPEERSTEERPSNTHSATPSRRCAAWKGCSGHDPECTDEHRSGAGGPHKTLRAWIPPTTSAIHKSQRTFQAPHGGSPGSPD